MFLIFLKIFEDSTLHGTLGKIFFGKIAPKTRSELVWILLGTILCSFGILFFFDFFWKFSKTRPSMENWAKNFRKISPITCSKHVWILLGTILGIFGILKFFFGFFRDLEVSSFHGTLGKFFFRKKSPQNTFKTRLDTFGNDLGQIRNFQIFAAFLELWKFFWFFSKIFENLTLHGKLGQKFSEN